MDGQVKYYLYINVYIASSINYTVQKGPDNNIKEALDCITELSEPKCRGTPTITMTETNTPIDISSHECLFTDQTTRNINTCNA